MYQTTHKLGTVVSHQTADQRRPALGLQREHIHTHARTSTCIHTHTIDTHAYLMAVYQATNKLRGVASHQTADQHRPALELQREPVWMIHRGKIARIVSKVHVHACQVTYTNDIPFFFLFNEMYLFGNICHCWCDKQRFACLDVFC